MTGVVAVRGENPDFRHWVDIACMPVTPPDEVDMAFVHMMSEWCGENCRHGWRLGIGAALFADERRGD